MQTVRLMAPFSMRCLACGEYIYKGRKFNARKETPEGERYLGIQIFRFYIKCTRCSGEITFKTDPKNQDYACERGAKRNTEPWRRGGAAADADETDEQRLDRLEREGLLEADGADGAAAQDGRNAMELLEAKTADARREMEVADALDEIRTRNARIENAARDGADVDRPAPAWNDEAAAREREDAEAARRAFAAARQGRPGVTAVGDSGSNGEAVHDAASVVEPAAGAADDEPAGPSAGTVSREMPPPSFKRAVKKKKDHAAMLGIKKKQPVV